MPASPKNVDVELGTVMDPSSTIVDFSRILPSRAPAMNTSSTSPSMRPPRAGGGSTMKTAKVWRYFEQLPCEEQAAECKICCKKIKATNSSTTGMIRHLRSCHVSEYQVLQEARQNGLMVKQEEKARALLMKQLSEVQRQKSIRFKQSLSTVNKQETTLPSVALTFGCDSEPLNMKKRATVATVINYDRKDRTIKKEAVGVAGTTDGCSRKVRENFWPDEHPEAKRITNQVGLMLLLDNETPAAVERAGFRGLMRLLEPKYRMPSADRFREIILPEIFSQLESDINSFQQAFTYNNFFGSSCPSSKPISSRSSTADEVGSVLRDCGLQMNTSLGLQPERDLDRVVINSIRSAQNISQSFSHSIQLHDEDTDSTNDANQVTLPSHIISFLERHAVSSFCKTVFSREQMIDMITRCHAAFRYFNETRESLSQSESHSSLLPSNAVRDLVRCIEFVHKNLASINVFHTQCPIPGFMNLSETEAQFLSDLNTYIHAI
ncbi:hypothetical protein AB6A40_004427 [Gnathostoma spinigerum]|uniref:BED-type domain-containing protein n=1 Tax=Gnathostoma spinigerum TaxID=75299 RepID=A0ABD6ECK9_9BILA